ncbi:MAG TPA: hypothetical protein RMH99_17265, partial [Sandaracinaceae bacterium LLY-WYZ-13_1]|nr:hypothetical protein [Sandaracinaceae bacterium LLY-WYZ-13_1]
MSDELLDEAAAALRERTRDASDGEATLDRVLETLASSAPLDEVLDEAAAALRHEGAADEDGEATLARIQASLATDAEGAPASTR